MKSDKFFRNPDVVLRENEPDEALLFKPDTNQIRVISSIGLFIYKHCDGNEDLPAIVATSKILNNYISVTLLDGQFIAS